MWNGSSPFTGNPDGQFLRLIAPPLIPTKLCREPGNLCRGNYNPVTRDVLGGRAAQQAVRRGAIRTKVCKKYFINFSIIFIAVIFLVIIIRMTIFTWVWGSMRGTMARGEPHPGGQQLVGGAVHLREGDHRGRHFYRHRCDKLRCLRPGKNQSKTYIFFENISFR